jgi:hypothetical protein
MGKSKNRANHKAKLATYKANKKKEQELFKKKMIDQYMKMQQENLANQEAHTSVEEVSGPEINLDELDSNNTINEFETINLKGMKVENISDAIIITPDASETVNNEK